MKVKESGPRAREPDSPTIPKVGQGLSPKATALWDHRQVEPNMHTSIVKQKRRGVSQGPAAWLTRRNACLSEWLHPRRREEATRGDRITERHTAAQG